ncbi:MAG: sulfatase-like hydrolase/transferase [Acidobacteria bacterium]|nr:sulfatase-like hydrolase/transferase [Acidobacteriota bacterium]
MTLVAATFTTLVEAVLLQYRRSYFTGGFLAEDFLTSPVQVAGFLFGGLLADAGVIGVVAAPLLLLAGWWRLPRATALLGTLCLSVCPLLLWDFVTYEIASYLGDAFDLGLMFDLTGRSTQEFVAVSWAHVVRLLLAGLAGAAMTLAALWTLYRRGAFLRTPAPWYWRLSFALWPILLLCAATGATAALRGSSDVLDNGLGRKPSGRWLGAVVTRLSDIDGDGYGLLGRPDDPDLFDARVRPYAVEVPGNGVDEDGVGGDLPAGLPPYREPTGPTGGAPGTAQPDVVLIMLESFRADALGAQVNGHAVTPVLDSLAAGGVSAVAFSHNGYTIQSRRHVFTGSTADVRGNRTLVDDFATRGYQVAYFSAQDESYGGDEQGVGFDRAHVAYDARSDRELRYSTFTTAGSLAVPHQVLSERVAAFLAGRHDDRPLFLYANFHDTHFPYRHRGIESLVSDEPLAQADIVPANESRLREMYLNTAANVDRAIGDLLDRVRAATGREPGVVVLGDHGESLFDEGFLGHGYALNDAQTRIPLVIANLAVQVTEPFGQSDLRDLLSGALRLEGEASVPELRRDQAREVFQYLGLIRRPKQIAFARLSGRTIYDFRSRRVRFHDSDWLREDQLPASRREEYLRLVHTWERIMLARAAVDDAPSP